MLPIKNKEHSFFTISAKRVLLGKRAGKERLNREGAKRCEEHEGEISLSLSRKALLKRA